MCSWERHYRTRWQNLPPQLQIKGIEIIPLIPKAHLWTHKTDCHGRFSFNYVFGLGRGDGEGIERRWSDSNDCGLSTRSMGPGARHDRLDHHWSDANYQKKVALGTVIPSLIDYLPIFRVFSGNALRRKRLLAIEMASATEKHFSDFAAAMPPEKVPEWMAELVKWEEGILKESPFQLKQSSCRYCSNYCIKLLLICSFSSSLQG